MNELRQERPGDGRIIGNMPRVNRTSAPFRAIDIAGAMRKPQFQILGR
jgi:hypothetical protein